MAEQPNIPKGAAASNERLAEELDDLDERLHKLQVLYDKFFLGIDRKPLAVEKERKYVSEAIRRLRTKVVTNTGLKFRIGTMFAKLISYERMWDRTLREIEDGTYKRDLFKMRLSQKKEPQPEGAPAAPRSMPPAVPGAPQAISDAKMKQLYDTYLEARQRCGEPTDGITYDALAQRVRAQIPTLIEKHRAKGIEFKVVIKGGKALLKAVPRT